MGARMRVKGTRQLQARMRAIKTVFRPIGRKWGTATVRHARPIAPKRTGKGARSIRVRTNSQRRTTVVANYYMAILDKGSKRHVIVPRKASRLVFPANGRTVFAKKVDKPAMRGLGFGSRAGKAALRDVPMAQELIDLWNRAA